MSARVAGVPRPEVSSRILDRFLSLTVAEGCSMADSSVASV